jgi:alpha-methylacyl-CoA racemase
MLELLSLDPADLPHQDDRARWPETKQRIAEAVARRTRDEWVALAADVDACVAPVLGPDEVEKDAHLTARETFVRLDGVLQPAPAPRFSRTPGRLSRRPPVPGEHTLEALADWGCDAGRVRGWVDSGAIRQEDPA